jgi:hypothetical protein
VPVRRDSNDLAARLAKVKLKLAQAPNPQLVRRNVSATERNGEPTRDVSAIVK